MTISTITLFSVAGGMLALKLGIMVMAVVLLAKALSSGRNARAAFPASPDLSRRQGPGH